MNLFYFSLPRFFELETHSNYRAICPSTPEHPQPVPTASFIDTYSNSADLEDMQNQSDALWNEHLVLTQDLVQSNIESSGSGSSNDTEECWCEKSNCFCRDTNETCNLVEDPPILDVTQMRTNYYYISVGF